VDVGKTGDGQDGGDVLQVPGVVDVGTAGSCHMLVVAGCGRRGGMVSGWLNC